MQSRFLRPSAVIAAFALLGAITIPRLAAAQERYAIPAWLAPHVGEGEGQIAETVWQRARALYHRKSSEGVVRNGCYFAMDATRPNVRSDGDLGRRFYIICENEQFFSAISSGHGGGRDLKGMADFSNGRQCAKNFGNAMDSELTAGGNYVTAETKASFKGYYRASGNQDAILTRSFIQFEGEGPTSNARERAIGGHAAVLLKGVCLRRDPSSPHADQAGYVPFGRLTEYAGGRSNGCTSWSPEDAAQVASIVRDRPTTLYIYPEAADIDAVARSGGRSAYWNATCLKEIHAPRYWSREMLEPIIMRYKASHPAPPPSPTPICRE